jgi:hypothetical protein
VKAVADGLRRLDGVDDVEVDLQANLCTLTPARDRVFALADVPAAVRATAYTPGRMWLRARGRLAERDGSKWFTIDGTTITLRVNGELVDAARLQGELTLGEPTIVVPGAAPR